VNHSTFSSEQEAYHRAIDTTRLERKMTVKIVRGTFLGLMVVASLTLFGAIVIG
jgi:hypothetical protein